MRVRAAFVLALGVVLCSVATVARAEIGSSSISVSVDSYSVDSNAVGLDGFAYCDVSNPSCGRDPWWLQFNEPQRADLLQFGLTGTTLTVEDRYSEAMRLLWGWGEGQALLHDGSEFGVVVGSGVFDRDPNAIAFYNSARRQIQINPRYARAATWMLAAVLSHELRHISDAYNRKFQGHSTEHCFEREIRAYETEARFISWFTSSVVGERLPVRELREKAPPEVR